MAEVKKQSAFGAGRGGDRRGPRPGGGGRRPDRRPKKPADALEHKVVDMRRVARVVSGGRRFSFRATVVAGDRKGKVGVGIGKGRDTAMSIEKALNQARKSMITVPMDEHGTIPHDVRAKFSSAVVLIRPGKKGRGLIAGSSVRTVLELAGVADASAKILSRSNNKLNNARVAMIALSQLRAKKQHATTPTTTQA
ncbi:MAG: 30S ribosomal protein S5 [Patescibacteria group bacterium]